MIKAVEQLLNQIHFIQSFQKSITLVILQNITRLNFVITNKARKVILKLTECERFSVFRFKVSFTKTFI